jgi:uncharacterized damage-inducible protein DinB
MTASSDLAATLLTAWRTNSRVTSYLVERVPSELWDLPIPGVPRRTVRTIAAHLHNSRSTWLRTLGQEQGITVPALVNPRTVTQRELLAALKKSGTGMESLLELALAAGGAVPATKRYVWRNLPLDVAHVLTYFVAHEGHHRGQIVMLARQLGHRLPNEISGGLWQWNRRMKE